MLLNGLTRGNQDQTLRNISSMGGVEIMTIDAVPPRSRDQAAQFGRSPGLHYPQVKEIAARIEEARFLLPQAWMPNHPVSGAGGMRSADFLSVEWAHFGQFELRVEPIANGTDLAADWANGAAVCLVGSGLARDLSLEPERGRGSRPARIRFAGLELRIAGIVEAKESGDWRNGVFFIPWGLYLKDIAGPDARLDGVMVKIKDPESMPAAARKFRDMLGRAHRGVPDFVVHTPEAEIAARFRANLILTLVGNFVAGLALLVGGIGILNLMWSSVNNRIREIGMRKALGASEASILFQFLTESGIISACGTVIGLCLGSLPLLLPPGMLPVNPRQTALDFALSGFVGSALGLLAGLYPALVASRFSPVEALSHA
jgi:ABC-type lipoprotein release transport system permease subunit